jgi:exosome complex component RRP45
MNAMRQGAAIGDNATMEDLPAIEEDEEDEKYRLRALDYSSGHIAASVKEDKDKKGSQGKNMKGETSSLFHAILRSAQSTSMDKRIDENDEPEATTTNSVPAEKKSTVEIVAHKVKQPTETAKPKQKKTTKQAQVASLEDSDEEEIVQLQSEFTTVEQASEAVSDQASAAPMEIDPDDDTKAVEKEVPRSKKSKSATRTTEVEVEDDDVDDLAMAVKKKKKTKKSKKK